MIISHQHRFIFFAVPKTGTHAVRRALRLNLGPEDQEQVGLFEQKALPFPELAAIRHGHLSVAQVQPVLGTEVFESYFKFAFVRNPFDRFVSYCAFMSRETGDFSRAPKAFMKYIIRELLPLQHPLFWPQHQFLVDSHGQLRMDYIGRNENMQGDYDSICTRLRFPSFKLDKVNASAHRPYAEYYDEELIDWVGQFYRRDLKLFDYRFEP